MVVRGCVYLPDRGRVRVDDGRIRSEFDPREDGPYHSRCARLAVVGRLSKPAPWMGDAALRKFTGLRSLQLQGIPPTFTLASLAGQSRLREVDIHVLSDVGLPPQNLTEIDDGPFRGLRELESLSIHGAGTLTRIHGAAFRDLVNLKRFVLQGAEREKKDITPHLVRRGRYRGSREPTERSTGRSGSLRVIPANLFKACTQLKELHLVNMGLEELEEDALAELRDLVTWFERRVGHVFPRRGPAAECIRLKYDAVNDVYRPLMYYWCTWHLWALGRLVVRLLGFRQDAADHRIFYRASTGPGTPLVFVHGIGIGFVLF